MFSLAFKFILESIISLSIMFDCSLFNFLLIIISSLIEIVCLSLIGNFSFDLFLFR